MSYVDAFPLNGPKREEQEILKDLSTFHDLLQNISGSDGPRIDWPVGLWSLPLEGCAMLLPCRLHVLLLPLRAVQRKGA